MSTRPTVACVIPTHARPELLRHSLGSVAAQDVLPHEVVVVSDVDDDATERVCAEFADRLPISYVVNVGSGASSSRNLGARTATADLIAFLDDDDLWEPGYLEVAVPFLDRADRDIVVTWFDVFDDRGRQQGERPIDGLAAAAVVAKNVGTTGSNLIVRRAAHDRVSGFDEALRTKNDTDYFYRLLASGATYVVLDRPLMLQRKHASGQLTDKSEMRARGHEAYMKKHAAVLSLRDRRDLRLAAHRIRRTTSTTRVQKAKHTALALFNYSLRKFREERALRARTRVGDDTR